VVLLRDDRERSRRAYRVRAAPPPARHVGEHFVSWCMLRLAVDRIRTGRLDDAMAAALNPSSDQGECAQPRLAKRRAQFNLAKLRRAPGARTSLTLFASIGRTGTAKDCDTVIIFSNLYHLIAKDAAGSHVFLPPIHCKSVPGVISSNPCL